MGSSSQYSGVKKCIKNTEVGGKSTKTVSIHRRHVACIENFKESTEKLLKVISELNRVVEY